MLLDTGADVTLLPQASVERLGICVDSNEGYELMGFDGSVSVAQVVEVDVLFLRRAFKGGFCLSIRSGDCLGEIPSIMWRCYLTACALNGASKSKSSGSSRCLIPPLEASR